MALTLRPPHLRKAPIRGDEAFQHRHDQPLRIGCGLAVLPSQRVGIGDKIAMQGAGQIYRHLYRLVFCDWTQLEFRHLAVLHGEITMSRDTSTRTGYPGRKVSVGRMLSWRRQTFCPAWLTVFCPPLRIARAISLVKSEPISAPIPSTV